MKDIKIIKEKSNYCLSCKNKPCTKGCPLGNNITDFINYIKQEKYKEAYETLTETTIMPAICGRICPHDKQCQGNCIRGIKQTPVNIGDLEAFIGDMAINENWEISKYEEKNNTKIAVIGGGPAGLTASAFLARYGFDVTIYEKYDKLGGILYKGIPNFRLDKEILENTILKIIELGIKVKYNVELGKDFSIEDLKKEYDAIILSFGANISSKMGVVGEELDGVYSGNELLEKENYPEFKEKCVAVIGGGNVAMDTARTINKLGAKKVFVIYRRAEKQMPAERKEIEDAKNEGIEFLFQNNIAKIIGNELGKVKKIELIKTELIKKEGEEREVPVNVENSNYTLDIDYVIRAVGSKTNEELLQNLNLELDKYGYVKVNENNETSQKNVFAVGDLVGTKSTVAWASRSGRDVAEYIVKNI